MKNIVRKITLLLTVALLVGSCGEEYTFDQDLSTYYPIKLSMQNPLKEYEIAEYSDKIVIEIAAELDRESAKDLDVEFNMSADGVEAYNKANDTDYEYPPVVSYSILNREVTITKGDKVSPAMRLTIDLAQIPNGVKDYIIPVYISSVSGNSLVETSQECQYCHVILHREIMPAVFGVENSTTTPTKVVLDPNNIEEEINLAFVADAPAAKGVTAKFKVDESMVAAYNDANGTSYAVVPAAAYSIEDVVATLVANEAESTCVKLSLDGSQMPQDDEYYLLPIVLSDIDYTYEYSIAAEKQVRYILVRYDAPNPEVAIKGAAEVADVALQLGGSQELAISVEVGYTSASKINVFFAADTDLVEQYNADNGTQYEPLPEAAYVLNPLSAPLAAGDTESSEVTLKISDGASLKYNVSYLLAVKISNVMSADKSVTTSDVANVKYITVERDMDNLPEAESLDRSNWEILYCNSEAPTAMMSAAFDGTVDTFWNHDWEFTNKEHEDPVIVYIDTKNSPLVRGGGFEYCPAKSGYLNLPAAITLSYADQISGSGESITADWVTAASIGADQLDNAKKSNYALSKSQWFSARYIKLSIDKTYKNDGIVIDGWVKGVIGEIYFYGNE